MATLRKLVELLPADDWPVRLTVHTNMLLDDPDVAIYTPLLGKRYMVHLLPVVLRELDDKKLAGRTPDLRDAAKKADRRLKGLRTNGNVLRGVRVAGDVHTTAWARANTRPGSVPAAAALRATRGHARPAAAMSGAP